MTLTVSVITQGYAACVVDRRLTVGRKVVSEQGRKLVQLDTGRFRGLVAYNGVGQTWKGETPNDWISEAQAAGYNLGIYDFCDRLAEISQPRLTALAPQLGGNPLHTFVFAGFDAGTAVLGLLSNYESFDDPARTQAAASFSCEVKSAAKEDAWACLMTGATQVTRKRSRDALMTALKNKETSPKVLSRMTKVIRDTAYSDRIKGSVGSSVMTSICDRYGGFEGGASVVGGGQFMEIPDAMLQGTQFRNIWMTTGPRDGSRYDPAKGKFDFVEVPCPSCGNPVPEGQRCCSSCDHLLR